MENMDTLPKDLSPYRWFIGILSDGVYRFIAPHDLKEAERYIGKHGGGIYTHAGFLVFAASKRWFEWLDEQRLKNVQSIAATDGKVYTDVDLTITPHIDVPNIECTFSPSALKWLEENDELLKEQGGKYYENIPRH